MGVPQSSIIDLEGGLDQITHEIRTPPGRLKGASNVWMVAGVPGYGRITGYERFDGHPSPYGVSFIRLDLDTDITSTVSVGDSITGGTSGAVGEVVALQEYTDHVPEDLWVPAEDDIILDQYGGVVVYVTSVAAFSVGETVTMAGSITADVLQTYTIGLGASGYEEYYEWVAAAQDAARDNISAPTGVGGILGVCKVNGAVYCMRNYTGGASARLWRSSTAGWVEVPMTPVLAFDAGAATLGSGQVIQDLVVGRTISGGTTGHTGTVVGIYVSGGTWASNNAVGTLTIADSTGTFQNNETLTCNGVTMLANGVRTAVTLSPDGKADITVHNFKGSSTSTVAVWTDGENKGFILDANNDTEQIWSGLSVDKPTFNEVFQNRVFLGFEGGLTRCSSVLWPSDFTSLTGGAHEIGTGDDITGIKKAVGNTLVFGGKKSIHLLQGADATTWVFGQHGESVGAAAFTMQGLGDVMFLSQLGINSLKATQAYGDFNSAVISRDIQSYIKERVNSATCSLISKDKGHYRIFFDDKSCACLTFDSGKLRGATILYYPFQATCAWSSIEDGVEEIYVGAEDGYVYQLDTGNSFDGEEITGFFRLPFHHFGSPRNFKQFSRLSFEMEAPILLSSNSRLTYLVEYNYASSDWPTAGEFALDVQGGGGRWDSTDAYESFIFDGSPVTSAVAYVDGVGVNASILVNFDTIYDSPFTFNAAVIDYAPLGRQA